MNETQLPPVPTHAAAVVPVSPRSKLKLASWLCAYCAVGVQLITAVLSVLSLMSVNPAWSMVTALVLVPFAFIVTAALGITSVILAIICRVRGGVSSKNWWIPLIVAVLAMSVLPVFLIMSIIATQ